MKCIVVSEIIGYECCTESGILLRKLVEENLNDSVTLDFTGVKNVTTTFFFNLLTNILREKDRSFILTHLNVKNLSNYSDYLRVVKGSSF